MPVPKIAINGFGRIGRLVTRSLVESRAAADIVAVNDLTDREHMAHLFRYDSVHGRFPGTVEEMDGELSIDGDRFRVVREPDPTKLPWGELEVDYVIECTGRFTQREQMQKHLDAGARRVVLSAPGQGEDVTLVRGVNLETYDPGRHRLVSNASCTTNALAPVLKVLNDAFTIEHALMNTTHAYTNDQELLDSPHKDLRRARAAGLSLIPTTTGAARAIGKVLPELDGKVDGLAVRAPVPNVSLVDVTARLASPASRDDVEEAFRRAARDGPLAGVLAVEEQPLVSVDFNHDAHSATVDLPSLMVVGDLVKVLAWYDNEWGYANRTAEIAHYLWSRETERAVKPSAATPA